MESVSTPILVTGATGYISGHVIKILLEKGYKVRGTVRSLANKPKLQFLLDLPNSKNLELFEADLNNEEIWDKAVQGCEYVLHIASPIPPYIPKHEDEIIIPAVNGTKFVTRAAIKHRVKRLVFTSSCLTLWFGNQGEVLTEEMWADPNKCAHYPKSKILAERALWELYNSQDLKGPHTEIVSVLPSLVLGPGLSTHGNSSEAMIAEVIKGGFPGIPTPEANYMVVDVRDTAVGHVEALFRSNLDGQRIALAGESANFSTMVHRLKKQFPHYNIKDKLLTVEEIKASGNPIAQRSLMVVGKKFVVENQKSKKLLNMSYTPVENTVVDMGHQLIKLGVVPEAK